MTEPLTTRSRDLEASPALHPGVPGPRRGPGRRRVAGPRRVAAPPTVPPSTLHRRRLAASSLGTLVEGYDWILYSSFAALVAPVLFFAPEDPLAASLGALATLAVAFIARPFGTVVFAHLADRRGRRPVLVATIALMGVATLAIAVAPTYAAVGALAPVVLVAARFVQGMAYSGEWAPATLVAAEDAPRRGRAAVTVPAALAAGSVLATLVLLLVTATLPREELLAWGWRVPFYFGAVLAIAVLLVRRAVPETDTFERARAQGRLERNPVLATLRTHARAVALLTLPVGAQAAGFYIAVILGQSWGVQLGYSRTEVTVGVLALAVLMVMISLLCGPLVDRYGAATLTAVGLGAVAAATVPWALLMQSGSFALALTGTVILGAAGAVTFAAAGPLIGGFFPAPLRASGMSLAFQFGAVLGGGVVPLVATAILGTSGSIAGVVVLLVAAQGLGLVALRLLGPAPEWTS